MRVHWHCSGNDVRNLSASCADIILNKEVIAINQVSQISFLQLLWRASKNLNFNMSCPR
eukprot:COSAG06_NODE_2396_length_6961_cov_11.221639_5_plen_59_part_00